MRKFNTYFIVIFFNLLWLFQIAQATDLTIELVSLPEVDETSFYKMIEDETTHVLSKLEPILSQEELKGIEQIKAKTLKIIKKINIWDHTKDLILTHGMGIALTSIISEVVTVLILPPILIGLDMITTATFVGVIPSPSYMIPAYLAVTKLRAKQKLAPMVGQNLLGLLKLEKLRRELVGFSIDHRIMSVIIKTLNEDHQINIIRRPLGRFRKTPLGNIIQMHELESLVKNHIGKKRFNLLKEYSHKNDSIFSYILMQEVNLNEKIKEDFQILVQDKIQHNLSPLDETKHSLFYSIHEKREVIERYQSRLRQFKSQIKKELYELGMTEKSKEKLFFNPLKKMESVTNFTKNLIHRLELLDTEIKVFEYIYLSYLSDGRKINLIALQRKRDEFIKNLKEINNIIDNHQYNHSKSSVEYMNLFLNDLQAPIKRPSCKKILNHL